jgi:hypothetical protein
MPERTDPSQVAAQIGVDEETIRRAIRSGDLPAQTTPAGITGSARRMSRYSWPAGALRHPPGR